MTTSLREFAYARRNGIGLQQYGPFDPATDRRDLIREAREELADLIVYLDFHGEKHGAVGAIERARVRHGAHIAWDGLDALEAAVRRAGLAP